MVLSVPRRALLEQTLQRAQFLHSCEEEEAWLQEHTQRMEKVALGRDLTQIATALQNHKVSVQSLALWLPTCLPIRHGALRRHPLPPQPC